MKKILGLGNALVDILIRLDNDQLLKKFNLPKGSMQLVNKEVANQILEKSTLFKKTLNSGGSAANTINGLAHFGVPTAYIGAIGHDKYGAYFSNDMKKNETEMFLNYRSTETGRATTLISSDSERTFATYLGAAIELEAGMLKPEFFKGYQFLHIEGYLAPNRSLFLKAMELAKRYGVKISIDLSSYNIVEENLEFFYEAIDKFVDVVFANEEEAKALTGKSPEQALNELSSICDIAVVKLGEKGSLIRSGQTTYQVGVIDVKSLDTTGAGDLYASGFLYGLVQNLSLDKCGEIGSVLSGFVIESIGARMDEKKWFQADQIINKILAKRP